VSLLVGNTNANISLAKKFFEMLRNKIRGDIISVGPTAYITHNAMQKQTLY
jgi:hypothetical protein